MPAKPEKELSEIAADYRDATFPDIDSNALLQLTRNIEVKLKAPTPAKSSKTPLSKSAKKGNEELQDCSHYLFAHGKKQATNKSRVNLRLSSPVQKQRSKTKRLRDGQLKDSSNSQTKASSIDPSVQEGQKKSNTQSEIEKEVMALGGTNEDFKLIDGLISDSEVEGGPTDTSTISRKDLEHDLRQIVKKFGTDGVKLKHRGNAPDTQENTVSFTPIQEAKRESLAAQSASGRKWANLPPKTSSTKDVPHLVG